MSHFPPADSEIPRRIVLLGASNLIRGISTIVETSQLLFGGPLEVFAAAGHGRSYGMPSTIVGRTLPGIVECGLWKDLRSRPEAPLAALVTDIGNDLMYGVPVEQIVDWVETCLDRLLAERAKVVMTLLPVANLDQLSPRAFLFFRTLFFPPNKSDLATTKQAAIELNDRVKRLGADRGVPMVEPSPDWYGLDPIHLRIRHWANAWGTILSQWDSGENERPAATGSLRRWFYLRGIVPQDRRIFGVRHGRTQPAGRLSDGTTVAVY